MRGGGHGAPGCYAGGSEGLHERELRGVQAQERGTQGLEAGENCQMDN
jgi:hypothetical protein